MKLSLKSLNRILLLLCTLIFTVSLSAATDRITPDKTIINISTYETYAAIKYSSTGTFTTVSCSSSNDHTWVVIDWSTNSNNKTLFNSALAAYALGKKVGFGINDNCHPFGGGVPRVYRVDIAE